MKKAVDRWARRVVAPRNRAGATSHPSPSPSAAQEPTRASAPIVEIETLLRRGVPLDDAVMQRVRELMGLKQHEPAMSLATSLRAQPATATIGAMAMGLISYERGYRELAWSQLRTVPVELWARLVPRQYTTAGLQFERERVVAELSELASDESLQLPGWSWLRMTRPAYGVRELELARLLFARLDRAVELDDDEELREHRDWLRTWIDKSPDEPAAPPTPAGTVSFAITDYGHPGRLRASANIGDHVQSVAALGHLVRHRGVTFTGPDDLVGLVDTLGDRVRPDLVMDSGPATVQLMTLHRDTTSYEAVPPNTWMLGFGWFMHPVFDVEFGLPFHRNVQPLFVSFHCNRRELLTPEAVTYLRSHGPIGCRDWTTVHLLLSLDVPAFFSGCITTTISTVFPQRPVDSTTGARGTAYIDAPVAEDGADFFKQSSGIVRFRGFVDNCHVAVALLDRLRHDYSRVVTSRLHGYLPLRSIGQHVEFVPRNPSDIRFPGLAGLDDAQFDAIRNGILDKLGTVMSAILAGSDSDTVYSVWREITAGDVADARRRHEATVTTAPVRLDLSQVVVDEIGDTDPDAIAVAITVRSARHPGLVPLLASLRRAASTPVVVDLVCRDAAWVDLDDLTARLPGLALRRVVTTGVGDGLAWSDGRRMTPWQLDTLHLAELLPDRERVVVLPPNGIVTGDVASLAAHDLRGQLLAAPDAVGRKRSSGFQRIDAAGNRLGARVHDSAELRRRAHHRHRFDFPAMSIDVLVADLAAWRASGLAARVLPEVLMYDLDLAEALMFELGPHRAVVEPTWDAVPTRRPVDVTAPGLIHWADRTKPWSNDHVPLRELWLSLAGEASGGEIRTAEPPRRG